MKVARFEGGLHIARNAGVVAAVALLITVIGAIVDTQRTLWAYHVAFVYWVGIAFGTLLINMSFQAGKAKWFVVTRRVVETIPLTGALFVVLFIPIVVGSSLLFPWINPSGLDHELQHLVAHRRPYLNLPFFLVRAGMFFLLWIVIANMLHRWSVRQDTEGGLRLTAMQRRLGAGALPFMGVAMTFMAFDWQMSVDLHLASTIFGLYWFAGSFLAAFAVVVLWLNALRGEGLPGSYMNENHYHSLGKYMLAFVAFWGYMAFSQYMLIWIANLPEEVPWYLARTGGAWLPFAVLLVFGHFVVPFFVLLSRSLKRNPRALGYVAVWILIIHYFDIYWVVMPALQHGVAKPHWTDLTALVGIGAAAVAFIAWRLRGHPSVPVGDPYLQDSLRYEPS